MRNLLIILSFSLAALGCESANHSQTPSSIQSAGSWSTMVGGTMMQWNQSFLSNAETLTFYKVLMPVGLGVVHEYIGVKAQMINGSAELATTGLVGDTDDAYFRKNLTNSRFVKIIRTMKRPAHANRMIRNINSQMRASSYNNSAVYASAMAMTPLLGRPCAKVAKKLQKFIVNY